MVETSIGSGTYDHYLAILMVFSVADKVAPYLLASVGDGVGNFYYSWALRLRITKRAPQP